MKCLIYQVNVGNPPEFYAECIRSVQQYCEKYNFKHIVQTDPIIRLRPVNSHRSVNAVERLGYLPHFEKANSFNYLDEYDKLAIIDSDIYIRESSPNLFDEIDEEVFAGVRESDMPLTSPFMTKVKKYSIDIYGNLPEMERIGNNIPFFNTGVMLFNNLKFKPYLNGNTPEEFVKRKEFEGIVNGEGKWKWASDQTLFNWWFQKENIKTKNLNWKWNTLYNGVRKEMLSKSYFLHFFLANKYLKDGMNVSNIIQGLK